MQVDIRFASLFPGRHLLCSAFGCVWFHHVCQKTVGELDIAFCSNRVIDLTILITNVFGVKLFAVHSLYYNMMMDSVTASGYEMLRNVLCVPIFD